MTPVPDPPPGVSDLGGSGPVEPVLVPPDLQPDAGVTGTDPPRASDPFAPVDPGQPVSILQPYNALPLEPQPVFESEAAAERESPVEAAPTSPVVPPPGVADVSGSGPVEPVLVPPGLQPEAAPVIGVEPPGAVEPGPLSGTSPDAVISAFPGEPLAAPWEAPTGFSAPSPTEPERSAEPAPGSWEAAASRGAWSAPTTVEEGEPAPQIPTAAPGAAPEVREIPFDPALNGEVAEHPTGVPYAPAEPRREGYREAGPNWMLAFVCAWAGVTSLNEAWEVARQVGLRPDVIRNLAFSGYGLLGLGLLVFALEALRWGRRRRGALPVLLVLVPTLLTLAGIICLVLSSDPGRRI